MALGGVRPGAGRKSKAEEFGLTEKMDSIGKTDEVLKSLYMIATNDKHKMQVEAQKLWLAYRLGKPQDNIDLTSNGEAVVIQFKDAE
jgi:hypothetical protein